MVWGVAQDPAVMRGRRLLQAAAGFFGDAAGGRGVETVGNRPGLGLSASEVSG
jgi:hypothetical protein